MDGYYSSFNYVFFKSCSSFDNFYNNSFYSLKLFFIAEINFFFICLNMVGDKYS